MVTVNRILTKYEDQAFDFADACVMHLAEREALNDVFTLDLNDFSKFRTSNGEALSLIEVG